MVADIGPPPKLRNRSAVSGEDPLVVGQDPELVEIAERQRRALAGLEACGVAGDREPGHRATDVDAVGQAGQEPGPLTALAEHVALGPAIDHLEVRQHPVDRTDTLDRSHLTLMEPGQGRSQTDLGIEGKHVLLGDGQVRPLVVVGAGAIGHHHRQAVVPAGEVDQHAAPAGRPERPRAGRSARRRADRRHRGWGRPTATRWQPAPAVGHRPRSRPTGTPPGTRRCSAPPAWPHAPPRTRPPRRRPGPG